MDDLVIASTTDSEDAIRAAMEPREEGTQPVLSEVDRATGQPVDVPAEKDEPPPPPVAAKTEAVPAADKKDEPAADASAPKKKSRSEDRINELTREKYLAQRKAERLQAELDAVRQKPPQAAAPAPQAAAATPQTQTPPTEEAEPQVGQYAVYEDYVKAITRWQARQVAREEVAALRVEDEQVALAQQQIQILTQFEQGKQTARERYPDFDQVMTSDVAVAMPITEAMQHVITTSPVGHDVAYYLVQHPDEAQALQQLNGGDALRLLGRLEERLAGQVQPQAGNGAVATTMTTAAARAPRVTAAPPPVEPIGGHATSTSSIPDDQLSYRDYKTKRDREEQARRRLR